MKSRSFCSDDKIAIGNDPLGNCQHGGLPRVIITLANGIVNINRIAGRNKRAIVKAEWIA